MPVNMASARVFFSKRRTHQRNGFISDEVPVIENGYEAQESDEDEVFVQDPSLDMSASKPLMHPRNKGQRSKVKTRTFECRLCAVCRPILYFVVLVTVLCGVMATIVYIANKHGGKSSQLDTLLHGQGSSDAVTPPPIVILGTDDMQVEDVWVVGFPKLLTESALRLLDVNGDGVLDVVLGFATGADGYGVSDIVCDLYFKGQRPCLGGILALDGKSGTELWRRYTDHEIFGLNCQYDIDRDTVRDCAAAGRAGTFLSVSGKTGDVIWTLGASDKARNPVMNFYTPQYTSDWDGDGVADLVVVHGGDPLQEAGSPQRLSGRILVVSGKSGAVLLATGVPDNRESYYSSQMMTSVDGAQVLLFGTGGETHNGSLWRISVDSLRKGMIDKAVKITSDTHKGFMTPPALVDVTNDGTEDILVPFFNSTFMAVDGKSYQPLWSIRFPSSETYSTPAVGYYNDDDVPDLMVKFAHGPGYPTYFYSETTVIDGKTGKKLIDPPIRDSIGSQASPLTISMEGPGNDVFLVWMADCKGHEGAGDEFSFVKGTSDRSQSKTNLCHLRFKSSGFSKLLAISQKLPQGGAVVYNSDDRKEVEHSKWVNTTAEAIDYIVKNPAIINRYSDGGPWTSPKVPMMKPEQEAYDGQNYPNLHRTSSKKGPSSPVLAPQQVLPNRRKGTANDNRQYLDGSSRYANNLNNPAYFPDNRRQDDYSDPYREDGSPDFLSRTYGAYYPSNGNLYNRVGDDEDPYDAQSYPYNYRSSKKRRMPTRSKKRNPSYFMSRRERRMKRHVAAHDDKGVQRLLSTGTLAPTLLDPSHEDYNSSIDIIFATYWSFPVVTKAILKADQACISEKLGQESVATFDAESDFYRMTHEEYEQAITQLCLSLTDHQLPEDGTYSNPDDQYNPLALNMGQMTVYRLRIKLTCSNSNSTESDNSRCATVLPFANQKWASYMGSNGDSHWTPPSP